MFNGIHLSVDCCPRVVVRIFYLISPVQLIDNNAGRKSTVAVGNLLIHSHHESLFRSEELFFKFGHRLHMTPFETLNSQMLTDYLQHLASVWIMGMPFTSHYITDTTIPVRIHSTKSEERIQNTCYFNSSWPHAFARIIAPERRASHGPKSCVCWSPGSQHACKPHFPRTSGHWAAQSLD